MSQEAVLGFDVGTSSSKAVLVASDGTVLASETCEHAVSRTPDGIVSMDARIWFEEFASLAAKLLGSADVHLAGIGVSGMGPCVALTDSSDVPVAQAALYGVDAREDGDRGADPAVRRRLAAGGPRLVPDHPGGRPQVRVVLPPFPAAAGAGVAVLYAGELRR